MEALKNDEETIEDVVSREHLTVIRISQSVKYCRLKNPSGEDNTPRIKILQ